MENLKEIIQEIKSYRKDLGMTFSDDTILECGTRIFNSMNINNSKEEIKNQPATDKQLRYLDRLGYKGSLKITKEEAKVLIEELVNKK